MTKFPKSSKFQIHGSSFVEKIADKITLVSEIFESFQQKPKEVTMCDNQHPAPLLVESFICRCKTEIRFHVFEDNAKLTEDQKRAMTANNILIVKKGEKITCSNCETEIIVK